MAAEDPLGAADTAVLVRETIRGVSLRHGLAASFSPKAEPRCGNGGHVHLSLWRRTSDAPANAMAGGDGPCGMTSAGESFTAGILRRLPALLAVGAPSVASYLRLVPSHRVPFSCCGLENREAALRFITGADGEQDRAANLEIKCFDPAANPYLALAALLAAGRAGIDTRDTLPAPVAVEPGALTPHERDRAGIAALPTTLGESVTAFEADPVLRQALGEAVIDTVCVVRRGEIELLKDATPEQVIAATRWRH